MPYNTTAIPPRKEVTGQTQLPLTRVKKIIAVDPDITVCSNNAAFVITLAAEMFVQYLTGEAQNMTKLERNKQRRNVQYKDLANAVSHHDNLEFLEDVIPKTTPYKDVKGKAAAARARVGGGGGGEKTTSSASSASAAAGAAADGRDERPSGGAAPSSKKQKSLMNGHGHGHGAAPSNGGLPRSRVVSSDAADPSDQLETEMRQAQRSRDGDVDMTG